jgi:type I restriction enzyme M protein
MPKPKNTDSKSNGSALGFEAQLWAAADKMHGHMDASEYKHACLGLIARVNQSSPYDPGRNGPRKN